MADKATLTSAARATIIRRALGHGRPGRDRHPQALWPRPAPSPTIPASPRPRAASPQITYIDGDAGILLHRGYPIDQLAEHSTFMEVSYLLLHGELPKRDELDNFTYTITRHTMLHEQLAHLLSRLPARRPSDGDHVRRGRRALGFLSRFDRHHRSEAEDDRQRTG